MEGVGFDQFLLSPAQFLEKRPSDRVVTKWPTQKVNCPPSGRLCVVRITEGFMKWLSIDVSAGWADLFVQAVKVAVVGFVVLQSKEWFDAGGFDAPAAALDAALIAAGTLVLNAIIKLARS